jgi:hypothetical protein
MNPFAKHILIFIASAALCLSSVFAQSHVVERKEQEKAVLFGYPSPFFSRDFSERKDFRYYPTYYVFSWKMGDFKETDVRAKSLVFSVGVFFFSLEFIIFVLEALKRNFCGKRSRFFIRFPKGMIGSILSRFRSGRKEAS